MPGRKLSWKSLSMPEDEEEPKEWEIEEEKPPERLERKWDEEEKVIQEPVPCPSCRKLNPATNLTCVFCEARFYRPSGFLNRLLKWLSGQ